MRAVETQVYTHTHTQREKEREREREISKKIPKKKWYMV
jgi:hypothetical protein